MSEEQKKYNLGIEKKEFNSLGEAVRYFRQKKENLTISSITQFMGWTHSQLMDIELGRKILTDMDIVKQLAEALEVDSNILLDLVDISKKPFIYQYEPDNFRPKILNKYEDFKKEITNCSTPKCSSDCSSCEPKKSLLELMDYIHQLEIIINYNPNKIDKPFNPSDFGTPDGSFNGTIYRTFDGKFTYKESNGVWVILASNGSKIPLVVFRGKIESNFDATIIFKSINN